MVCGARGIVPSMLVTLVTGRQGLEQGLAVQAAIMGVLAQDRQVAVSAAKVLSKATRIRHVVFDHAALTSLEAETIPMANSEERTGGAEQSQLRAVNEA